MRDRSLLKDAIADAKLIKDTAIANAKMALEESFTPHLKSMFEAKLKEMDGEEDDELMFEEEETEETETETEETEESETEETEETEEETEEEINIEDMSEADLTNFIESVIQDMVESGELGDTPTPESEETTDGEEDITDTEGSETDFDFGSLEGGDDEEVDVDELVNEIKKHRRLNERKRSTLRKPTSAPIQERKLKLENLKLKNELRKSNILLETLKKDFREVNLLNSKLLYVNKIFKAKTLNEEQKVKVLNSFDKAKSLREVKTVYETLRESLSKKTTTKPINERLGFASKSIKAPGKINESQQSNSSIDQKVVNRWQELAGLK